MDQPKVEKISYKDLWEEDQRRRKARFLDDIECRCSNDFEKELLNDDDDADCFCD